MQLVPVVTMLVAATLLVGAAVFIVFAVRRDVFNFLLNVRRMAALTKNIPSPPAYPIVGCLPYIVGDPNAIYETLMDIATRCAPTCCFWMGFLPFVFVSAPEDLQEVMTNPKLQTKSFLYGFLTKFLGRGLVTINGKRYRRHRKAISPALHVEILNEFVSVFSEESRELANKLVKLANSGEVFDVQPMCGWSVGCTVSRTLFSAEIPDEIDMAEYITVVKAAGELFMHRLWHPWLLNDWLYSWSSKYQEYTETREKLELFGETMLRIKSEQISKTGNGHQTKRRLAFMDHMLMSAEGAAISREEFMDETRTLFAAGIDTSMMMLTLLCLTMAVRQDIQQKVQQEVDAIYGSDDTRPVEPSDLPHLEYIDRLMKEVLRYFPMVPGFIRHCRADVKFPSGFTAPKGCQILIFLPALHRNPEIFPEPLKFDPDRFLPERSRDRHPYSFLPFSAGTRNCIGQRYAMMFVKTAVANLVRRIQFLPAPGSPKRLEDVKLRMEVVLSLIDPANIRVQRRCHSRNVGE